MFVFPKLLYQFRSVKWDTFKRIWYFHTIDWLREKVFKRIKSILIRNYQYKSTRVDMNQHESTRINKSPPTWFNLSQHESTRVNTRHRIKHRVIVSCNNYNAMNSPFHKKLYSETSNGILKHEDRKYFW